MNDLPLSEIESVDYIDAFPGALRAEGRDTELLVLYLLTTPRMIWVNGKKRPCRYELEHRWLSQPCQDERDQSWACVEGSQVTYWHKSQIDFGKSLYDQFSMF